MTELLEAFQGDWGFWLYWLFSGILVISLVVAFVKARRFRP